MSTFLERFALAVLATLLTGVTIANPFKLDRWQQAGVIVGIVGIALFVGATVERMRQPGLPQGVVAAEVRPTSQAPSQQTTPAPVAAPRENPVASRARNKEAPAGQQEAAAEPRRVTPTVRQHSEGPNSPNIVTFGDHSPVTVTQVPNAWTLTETQQQAIAKVVKVHRQLWDGNTDLVLCTAGDPDSASMAESFVAAFRQGGWPATYGQSVSSSAVFGIEVYARLENGRDVPSSDLQAFIGDLAGALLQSGAISGPLRASPGPTRGRFMVRVGSRPRQ